ncbi:hypothetical protein AAES_27594 [Amazona aestiva]|uniref:Uncharacterized protein n=1 Tax=Amazona aestiva TaxID=12930 RepID=A0A0Q3WJU5_AMAAE|nr:hypothetical protein AAES_27594 [Amazona aestiva]
MFLTYDKRIVGRREIIILDNLPYSRKGKKKKLKKKKLKKNEKKEKEKKKGKEKKRKRKKKNEDSLETLNAELNPQRCRLP